ncbi:AAA family ATPase [bacterium]|nr:AAA family ATPase [bacterium]
MDRRKQERNSSGQNVNIIKSIEIRNFKSIKEANIKCKRINIFIGEPNTGKSNILESLGFLSALAGYCKTIRDFVRCAHSMDFFYNKRIKEEILIKINEKKTTVRYSNGYLQIFFNNKKIREIQLHSNLLPVQEDEIRKFLEKIKFYRFTKRENFPDEKHDFLLPSGENLLTILETNEEARKTVENILSKFDILLNLKILEQSIGIAKKIGETIVAELPYYLLSDTLQRLIYYICAIESNENSILIFEEPESHAFPYYTKFLAECISFDEKNQYFITTHNPYFLLSILEKSKKEDIGIFCVYLKGQKTVLKELSEEKREKILDYEMDIFFNIEKFIEN